MKEEVQATRMELLKLKGRVKLAKKGHSLLKRKRDALILELFRILKGARDMRKELYELFRKMGRALFYASISHTQDELELLSTYFKMDYDLEVKEKNIMGVKIPEIKFNVKRRLEEEEVLYLSKPSVDLVYQTYSKALEVLVEIANFETTVKKLLKEIEKTKRRVNALEYNIIPQLEEQVKYIRQRLDELERESFVALKTLKRKMARQEAA